ncbi:MAG: anti-sigma factor RsbA family regulatory protein, partial [Acidimicrobiales bacterium]|nr:anti-sigma factor RsbA family regulatory protein [Acidimicrobiales bacterium]
VSGTAVHGAQPALTAFHHEAFLYAGAAAFLEGTVPFIEAGLVAGEPVLVVVGQDKIRRLRKELGGDAGRVAFADMAEVGRNPARIIPAWRDFLATHRAGGPARGIGEPVYSERTPDELLECQRHEALLNVAFAGGAPWRLMCPYDTTSLDAGVIEAARHSHRFVAGGHSSAYRGDTWTGPDQEQLPEPPAGALPLAFGQGPLEGVRQFVVDHAGDTLDAGQLSDLLVAVTEVAGNSLMHGGGAGSVRVWHSATGVVCEVRDRGWIRQPLVGRARPTYEQESGRGLWMVNQLCDLVQLRSSPAGTVVRLHMARRDELDRL